MRQLWRPERVASELRTNQGFSGVERCKSKNGDEVNKTRGFHGKKAAQGVRGRKTQGQ